MSLVLVHDDDVAEQVAIVICLWCGCVGPVLEFAHPEMLRVACLAICVDNPVSFLA